MSAGKVYVSAESGACFHRVPWCLSEPIATTRARAEKAALNPCGRSTCWPRRKSTSIDEQIRRSGRTPRLPDGSVDIRALCRLLDEQANRGAGAPKDAD